jgi:hypothetical protein
MKLTPTDLTAIAAALVGVIYAYRNDDPRAWDAIKAWWSRTVGAWCAKRRTVIRVGRPDEHSAGILSSRRDINTGNWT